MNVDKLSAEQALEAGADLWIVPQQQDHWWQQLDFHSGFLLSTCLLHQKTEISAKIEQIVAETEWPKKTFLSPKKSILIGSENHFLNKWILVLPNTSADTLSELSEICDSLKVHSARFFSTSPELVQSLSTRLSTSLNRISFVE